MPAGYQNLRAKISSSLRLEAFTPGLTPGVLSLVLDRLDSGIETRDWQDSPESTLIFTQCPCNSEPTLPYYKDDQACNGADSPFCTGGLPGRRLAGATPGR